MIYQPSKYHTNSFTHFLQLHSSITNNNSGTDNSGNLEETLSENNNHEKLDLTDNNSSSNTSLEVVNDTIGKSFTIAAILGLKKNSVCGVNPLGINNRQNHQDFENAAKCMNEYNSEFSNLINFTAHSKLFHKFEGDNNCYQSNNNNNNLPVEPTSQMEHCLYENNTSNSSYQEHLHKQLNQEFNPQNLINVSNFHRNGGENAVQHNQMLHNLQQHSSNPNNLLNKTLQPRDRNRLDPFPSKNKSSSASVSLKNKRVRTIFTPEQLERLEAEFERQQYMVGPERLYLAHTLQLTEAQVKVWFQNRRIKWRKHHLEITQQHLAIARQRQIAQNTLQQSPHNVTLPNQQDSPDLTPGSDSMDGRIGVSDIDD